MRTLIAFLMIGAAFAQEPPSNAEGPVFDNAGQLRAYVYSDGTKDQYMYDSALRMIKFTDRAGRTTTFVYGKNGTMTTVLPDGTTLPKLSAATNLATRRLRCR